MTATEIEKIVDASFDEALKDVSKAMERELYPAAFADPSSWQRVKGAIDLNNKAIREAVKASLSAVLDAHG